MAKIIICFECRNEEPHYAKELCKTCYHRQYREQHRQKRAAYSRRYHHEHREERQTYKYHYRKTHRQEIAAYAHRYRAGHQEEHRAENRRWYAEHRERCGFLVRRYQQQNPEKVKALKACRRARKRSVANTLTPGQVEFERKIGEVVYPGERLHLHHLVPLSKGGGHSWGNIIFIPASLNMSIKGKLPEEIYRQETLEVR